MKWLAAFIAFLSLSSVLGQGCSDAGFCTIPSFKPLNEDQNTPFQLELRASLEGSEPGALIISPQLWFQYAPSAVVKFSVKLPYWLLNDDSLGSVATFNDPIVSTSIRVHHDDKVSVHITGGFRFGLNNANRLGTNDISLPMDYQSSLGTTDLIIGGNARFGDLSASLALQFPVWQYNENQHVVLRYLRPQDGIDPTTLRFDRKADIMLRIDKRWTFTNWGVQVGLLPIYHLANDELKSTENTGIVIIEGSSGLTVNVPFGAWYRLNSWTFGLDGGVPILVRDERPDGLTRRFVIQPRVAYSF